MQQPRQELYRADQFASGEYESKTEKKLFFFKTI